MSITFSDMQTRVFDDLREPTDGTGGIDTTLCKRVVNDMLAEVVDQLKMEVPADDTIALVAGTSVYDYPTAFFSIERVSCLLSGAADSAETVLRHTSMEELDRHYGDGSWRTATCDSGVNPTWFYGVGWNQIRLVPIPEDAGTLYVRGQKGHADLSNDADTSILPDEVVRIALRGAVWYCRGILQQVDAAQMDSQAYLSRLLSAENRWPGRQPKPRMRFKMS